MKKETLKTVLRSVLRQTPFTKTELRQLLSYAEHRDFEGWYYGNKAQFEKRHQAILSKLQSHI